MAESEPESLKALTVRAGDRWCALPLSQVRRVVRSVKLHPLPGADPEIAGLAEIDGEPLVILSLERLIESPPGPTAEFPVALIVEAGGEPSAEVLGLLADEAGDIVRFPVAAIAGPPRGLVRGEARLEQGVVEVLDLELLGREG
jgi:chemotaxis signal transduction protein